MRKAAFVIAVLLLVAITVYVGLIRPVIALWPILKSLANAGL
jgi:hypothetical protein